VSTPIDWTVALAPGARIIPVLLVAGVPIVVTPAGVRPVTVTITTGSADALWWPSGGALQQTLPDASTFDPVEDLLDTDETFEVFERASSVKGEVRVEALTFSILDTDGRGTALLSSREARVSQLLASEVSALDTSIPLVSVSGLPSSGIACLNRETFLYSSISGTSLVTSLVTRGRYGSAARMHGAPADHLPMVTAGGVRHWQGRLATLWLCVLSADGTTLTDPSLFYAGTVGAGVQLKGNLTRWSVPLDHITETLSRKLDAAPIDLYGYAHYSTAPEYHPMRVGVSTTAHPVPDAQALQWADTATENGGWHPSRESFVVAANAVLSSASSGAATVGIDTNGKMVVRVQGSDASPRWFSARAAWDVSVVNDYVVNTDRSPAAWVSAIVAPPACFRLDGWVRIPAAADLARIPSTFVWAATTTNGATGAASLSLVADTRASKANAATIVERDAGRSAVRVVFPTSGDPLCTARTPAKLGVIARGSTPVAALLAGAAGIDAIAGQDLYQLAVDWDHLEAAFNRAPSGGLTQAREYRFGAGADSFLAVLIHELRLRGMTMAIRNGRITGVRLQSLSDVENAAADIVETDTLCEGGVEIPVEVMSNDDPLATSVVFSVPNGTDKPTLVSVTDTTFQSEFGDGEKVECKALLSVPDALAPGVTETLSALYAIAQQILGPLAEPSRAVRLPLSPLLMGLQPGSLVRFTHSRIPTWSGVRGVTAAVCQVQEVRRVLFGGRLRATVSLRLQSSVSAGYCPEAMVAAGGLTGGSAVVHVDTTTGWGVTCHAQDTTGTGAASTNAIDGFAVGDAVLVSEVGTRTPAADEARTIVAVDAAAGTLTLSAAPGAGMVARAAAQYAVTVRWAGYDAATARQKLGFAWIADAAGTLGTAVDPPRRFAS